MAGYQVVDAQAGILVLEAPLFHNRCNFLIERQGQVQLAGGLVGPRQVAYAGERVGVVGPQFGPPELQGFLTDRQSQVQLPGHMVGPRQVVHADERVGDRKSVV